MKYRESREKLRIGPSSWAERLPQLKVRVARIKMEIENIRIPIIRRVLMPEHATRKTVKHIRNSLNPIMIPPVSVKEMFECEFLPEFHSG